MILKPFFTYYGGKYRAALHYPAPSHERVVEPFCGSAGYSLRYHDRKVRLYDKNETITDLWKYLIRVKSREILSLPDLEEGDSVDDLRVCQEAKSLIGFWLNKGNSAPCKIPSKWMRSGVRPNSFWGATVKQRIASQVKAIRHWKVWNRSYEDCADLRATWFLDPPYQGAAGRHYKHSHIRYKHLASWCKTRRGQVIVCENSGADWLPFQDFRTIKGSPGAHRSGVSKEVLWYRSQ